MDYKVEKKAFEIKEADRGFTVKAYYLEAPHAQHALVEIFKENEPYRRFLFPAYKIWNIAAHFHDIVDSEINGNFTGYNMAAWTGFGHVDYLKA